MNQIKSNPATHRHAHGRSGSLHEGVEVYAPESNTFGTHDHAVGQVISGRFRVERVIGVGSMGVVLAARHLELDERVAIKFIRSEMQQLPGVLSRFAREAKAAVSIKSEHVAKVIDVGTDERIGPYIVMEYLEGCDLGAVLELEGRLPIRRAVHYVMQACEALAVAHSAGITHRDIKPENLFLTRQGDLERIKLLDFGISKAALTGTVFGDELSNSETACLLGTPLYMSPEQIQSTGEVDPRTDIWSLGAVLYELITARSAFVADTVREVWTRILETSPALLATHCPEAPPSLQAVIDRCLEKDPALRFQTVADLAVALLPFAPSRARLYAQHASSILGAKSDSVLPAPRATPVPARVSSAPLAVRASDAASRSISASEPHYLAVPVSDISAPPVFHARSTRASSEPSKSQLIAAMAVAGLLGALCMVWFGSRRVEPMAARPDPIVGAPAGAWAAAAPPAPAAEEAETTTSRSVLIESQPSGALVSVGGQAVGLTPLSTLLPVGMVELTISKSGYATEQAYVQLDAAPRAAKAVRTRVILREAPAPLASPTLPSASVAPPTKATRPAPRRAPPRRAEPAREEASAAANVEPVTAPVRAEVTSVPTVEAVTRARLIDEAPRARLVD